MGRFDTVLIGRRSYDAALAGPGIMPGMQTFVFSRTLRAEDHPGVTIVNDDNLADTLASLRRTSGKEIWLFGGGDLFHSLLAAGGSRQDRGRARSRPPRPGNPFSPRPQPDRAAEAHRDPPLSLGHPHVDLRRRQGLTLGRPRPARSKPEALYIDGGNRPVKLLVDI